MTPGDQPELAALLALDALPDTQRAGAEALAGPVPAELLAVVASLAEAVAVTPPGSLRRGVLDLARERRPVGAALGAPVPCSPLEGYRRAADDLHRLLQALGAGEWTAPAHDEHGDVRTIIAHLVGVEQLMLAWVGARPAPDPEAAYDHIEATRATVEALAGVEASSVAERWHRLVSAVAATAGSVDLRRRLQVHDMPVTVEALLVLRAFELWAHTIDVCTATGRPLVVPDPARLALMSSRLAAGLAAAMLMKGTPAPGRTARIVLTGAAPLCRDVALGYGEAPGEPDTVIVADAVEACRVAARRLRPADLESVMEGDTALAHTVVAAFDAFARD